MGFRMGKVPFGGLIFSPMDEAVGIGVTVGATVGVFVVVFVWTRWASASRHGQHTIDGALGKARRIAQLVDSTAAAI
jgi:hypothetical protein